MRKTTMMLMGLLLAGLPGFAQTISGSIAGRVVDAQGAVVPNASVTVIEPSKNLRVSSKTSTVGDFLVPGLLPGNYSITIETTGFKKLSRTDITLDANDKLALGDLVLEVGALTETVKVSAQAVLQSESVERSATISGKQITNIEVKAAVPWIWLSWFPAFSLQRAVITPSPVPMEPTTSRWTGRDRPRISSLLMASGTSTPVTMAD